MESIEQQINLSWEEIFNSFQECNACQIEEETEQAMPVCDPVPSAPTTPVVTEEKAKVKKSKEKTIGLIVGTILIIIGLTRILSAGTTISSTSFGGDFYTYTYRGIVAITEQLASIQASLGWVIVAIGAAIDVHVLNK